MDGFPYVVITVSISTGCDFCTCCHWFLSRNNGWRFPCVLTACLITSERTCIGCHRWFTMQWMWFCICCHCSLSKDNGCCFPFVVIGHLISSGGISICCHYCFIKQWMSLSHVVTALFEKTMIEVFYLLSQYI